ncbi:hypothetical protein DFP72DRAFT_847672 [Ephemerocybe angulata]|uniref:Uncharacterized protein n=1 Tax=Ephemerocybe angulata TaxID=980116 RepID=A0A8H6M497_9AGAR|nr:hypothetical protein DFP72DRAFT_847666 [Tulosesus angulatus]KAF6755092.1 hypothetical protein DFP72DRAFT_847672 [Tulosesus angulatus]
MTFFRNCALSSMPPPHNAKAMVNMAQLFSSVSTYLDYRKGYSMVNGRSPSDAAFHFSKSALNSTAQRPRRPSRYTPTPGTLLPSPLHFPDLQKSNFRFSSSFHGLRLVDLASLRCRYSPASHTVTAYSTMLTGTPSHSPPSPDTDIHLQPHKTSLMIPTLFAGFRHIVSRHGTDRSLPTPRSLSDVARPTTMSEPRFNMFFRKPICCVWVTGLLNVAIRLPGLSNNPRLFQALLVILDCSPSSLRHIHESPSHQQPRHVVCLDPKVEILCLDFLGHFASFCTPALPVHDFIRHPAQIPRPISYSFSRQPSLLDHIHANKGRSRAVSTPFKGAWRSAPAPTRFSRYLRSAQVHRRHVLAFSEAFRASSVRFDLGGHPNAGPNLSWTCYVKIELSDGMRTKSVCETPPSVS